MPRQRQVDSLASTARSTPKHSQYDRSHSFGHDGATDPLQSVTPLQHGLDGARNPVGVLDALARGTRQQCVDIIDFITQIDGQLFSQTYLGNLRPQTLRSLARCLSRLPDDSNHCRLLLSQMCTFKLDQNDLADSGLLRRLGILYSHAPKATAVLAKKILDCDNEKPEPVGLHTRVEASVSLIPRFEMHQDSASALDSTNDGKPFVNKYPVCFVCNQPCIDYHSSNIWYCCGCIRGVHRSCCQNLEVHQAAGEDNHYQGQVWCGSACKDINTASRQLVRLTSQQGYFPLTAVSDFFPSSLGISFTSGFMDLPSEQADTILSAAVSLLPGFQYDRRILTSHGKVQVVKAFVRRQHPTWCYNNTHTLTLWALPPGQDRLKLQGCLAVSTIVYRILGKDLVDVLYAATHEDLQGCRLMQVAMLALQLQLHEMGVHRVYLDASNKLAKDKWLSPAMGFTQISDQEHEMLVMQYSLVENDGCAARCLKLIPTKAALLDKVRVTTPKVPEDLFQLKKDNMKERLRKNGKQTSDQPNAGQLQTRAAASMQMDKLAGLSIPNKRRRLQSSRLMTSDVRLSALKSSFTHAKTPK